MNARARDKVVHLERGRDETGVRPGRRPSSERRDSDDPLDPVSLEGGASRPSEVEVRGVHGLRARIWWHEPEDGVRAGERLVHDGCIAVRALHNVDSFADMRRETRRVACDHADWLLATKNVLENLAADGAVGSGHDDHVRHDRLCAEATSYNGCARISEKCGHVPAGLTGLISSARMDSASRALFAALKWLDDHCSYWAV